MTVGILALQGDFREHEAMLHRLGVPTQQVRLPKHLDVVERLIIPGGESTTIGKLLQRYNLLDAIRQRAGSNHGDLAVWGTCAGTILMAQQVTDGLDNQPRLGLLPISVQRNAYGRQRDSFEAEFALPVVGKQPFRGVFIRAPIIQSADPPVTVLGTLPANNIVAAQYGRLLTTTFHPELTDDDRVHRYFLEL